MNNFTDNKQPVDPKLMEMIELMRATPERDPQSVAHSRKIFLSELEGVPAEGSKSSLAWLSRLLNPINNRNRENSKSMKTQKFAFSTLMVLIVGLVMLFGGASATAYASQSALPGDALYPIKTSLEQTQVALARNAYSQAQIHMQFAQRRLDEINELLQEGRYADIDAAAGEFEFHIQQAMLSLQTVMTGDPEQGAVLSQEISQALLDYALTLKAVLVNTPEPVKSSVEKALLVSESSAGEDLELVGVVLTVSDSNIEIADYPYPITISGLTEIKDAVSSGDTVKVHIIIAADGTRIAREIEIASAEDSGFVADDSSLTDEDQNSNESISDEDFSDDNLNSNESNSNDDAFDDLNENGDDSNENSDDHDGDLNNTNDDDHAGDEQNDNGNDNDNSSGDDSGDESDDDHSNANDNSSNDDDHSNDKDNSSDDDDSTNHNSNDNSGESDDEIEGNSNDHFSDDD